MPTIKYWKILGSMMDKAKENIPKQFRIGDTCFTSLANIGGNLFTRHTNNLNHVNKDINDILSVIIILVTSVHGSETFFYDVEWYNTRIVYGKIVMYHKTILSLGLDSISLNVQITWKLSIHNENNAVLN